MTLAVETDTKYCPGCKEHLPVDAFGRNRTRSDHLNPKCRNCQNAYNRRLRATRNGPRKDCGGCGRLLPVGDFPRNPLRPDGRGTWCTPCHDREARRTRNAITVRRQQRAAEEAAARAAARVDRVEIGAAWQKRAACGLDTAGDFFPDSQLPGASDAAEEICVGCPVADLCARDAELGNQRTGVWAGRSREPRKRKQPDA